MATAAPIIYSFLQRFGRVIGVRVPALAVACGCLWVLITAASLPPSHLGYGTHQRLGMAACQFLERTGIPCPGCGMTTSFSWFVRGNIVASVYVQPMGTLLAVLCCFATWGGLYVVFTGRPVHRLLRLAPGNLFLMTLAVAAAVAWGWKILIHLSGHDGW